MPETVGRHARSCPGIATLAMVRGVTLELASELIVVALNLPPSTVG
jgi:hypothetical protein